MGRIKPAQIKRTAEKLMPDIEFKESFEDDKKILGNTMPSKRMKNVLAGYIARLVKRANAKQKSLETTKSA